MRRLPAAVLAAVLVAALAGESTSFALMQTTGGTGTIAGSYVLDGRVTRTANVRLQRDNVVIHTGKVSSLKRFKDDASEVKAGFECGIGIAGYNDIKPGDVIEFFTTERVKETLT